MTDHSHQGDASTELGMSSDVPTEPVVDLANSLFGGWLCGWHPWLRREAGHFGLGLWHRKRLRTPQGHGTSMRTHRVRRIGLHLDWRF